MRAIPSVSRVARVVSALSLCGALAAAAILSSQTTACGPTCSAPDRFYGDADRNQGRKFVDHDDLVYETSPIDGPFLPFEGAVTYHIRHGLGVKPYHWEITLSFSDRPEASGGGGSAASAGNQAVVVSTTENDITINNNTCASYYFRVVVFANVGERRSDAAIDSALDSSDDSATDSAIDSAIDSTPDAPVDGG